MLNNRLPVEQKELKIAPSPIEVVLAEEGAGLLALILPPVDDLREMSVLKRGHFSLTDHAFSNERVLQSYFTDELAALERKRNRFKDSPSFLTRLADVAELAGDRVLQARYLEDAAAKSNDEFFRHRIGENLIARQHFADAARLLNTMDLDKDAFANLRLSYLRIQSQDLQGALEFAAKAIEIIPFDFSARLLEGALLLANREYERAIRSFRIATESRQNSSVLHANMAIAYVCLKRTEKAFASLRRAVALDPLNKNAVTLLADLAFREKRNEDAVPSLRLFLEFEQTNSGMWARLARALLELGEINESIAALKRQGSLQDDAGVWNNLGVAYRARKDTQKAFESFKYALTKDAERNSKNFFLAARNAAVLMTEEGLFRDAASFVKSIISEDATRDFFVLRDRELSDLYAVEIVALRRQGKLNEAVEMSSKLLLHPASAINLKGWLAAGLIAHLALEPDGRQPSIDFARKYEFLVEALSPKDRARRDALLNNLAFAYVEAGLLTEAERYLSLLSSAIHKEPYPTATLGLIHLRKGHLDRAQQFYEEAISLAHRPRDKTRIRQKLNLELARLQLETNPRLASRLLGKVVSARDGDPQLLASALRIQRRLASS